MLNNITLMGRLTRAPELRLTQTGKSVASFTIAVDRDFDRQKTDFINCVTWGSTAEFVDKHFTRGQLLALSGRLQMREWTDKSGNNRVIAEVIVDHVYFTGDRRQAENTPAPDVRGGSFTEIYDDDGELPF